MVQSKKKRLEEKTKIRILAFPMLATGRLFTYMSLRGVGFQANNYLPIEEESHIFVKSLKRIRYV